MDILQAVPFTGCTTKAGASAGTTTTLTTANITLFGIRGKAYLRAATANAATPTTDIVTGVAFLPVPVGVASAANGQGGFTDGYGHGALYVVGCNAAGALRVAQGSIERTTAGAVATSTFQAAVGMPRFPALPDDFCPFCYIVVKTDSTAAAWTFGTSNLTGPPTGVTITFVDLMSMPDRAQVS